MECVNLLPERVAGGFQQTCTCERGKWQGCRVFLWIACGGIVMDRRRNHLTGMWCHTRAAVFCSALVPYLLHRAAPWGHTHVRSRNVLILWINPGISWASSCRLYNSSLDMHCWLSHLCRIVRSCCIFLGVKTGICSGWQDGCATSFLYTTFALGCFTFLF